MLYSPTRTDQIGLRYLEYYAPHNVYHPGTDFNWGASPNADFGQDVRCPTWGIVEYVSPPGTNGGLGKYLVIRHPHHGVWTRYLHLEDVLCEVGQTVAPNQVIAKLGDSGTTSAHLHAEVLNDQGLVFIRDWSRPYGRYPTGLSKQKVASMRLDPEKWVRESNHPAPGPDLQKQLDLARKALGRASPGRRRLLERLIERLLRLLPTPR